MSARWPNEVGNLQVVGATWTEEDGTMVSEGPSGRHQWALEHVFASRTNFRGKVILTNPCPDYPRWGFLVEVSSAFSSSYHLTDTLATINRGVAIRKEDLKKYGYVDSPIGASGECEECFGTGLKGGFHAPCSRGCEVTG